MYVHTYRVCFCHFYKFGTGHDGKIKNKTCKKHILRCIFILGKYMLKVCYESSFYKDDIHPEIEVAPPGPIHQMYNKIEYIIQKFMVCFFLFHLINRLPFSNSSEFTSFPSSNGNPAQLLIWTRITLFRYITQADSSDQLCRSHIMQYHYGCYNLKQL